MAKMHKHIFCGTLAVLFLLQCSSVSAHDPDTTSLRKVLIVHSYHPEYEWVASITRGLRRALAHQKDITYEMVYMDTKRHPSEASKQEAGKRVRGIIDEWHPDTIVTVDDNAQEYVGKYYAKKDEDAHPRVVFCGVNNEPKDYGYDTAANVTGMIESPHFMETMELVRASVPDMDAAAVLSDLSPTSKGALAYIEKRAADHNVKLASCEMIETFQKWQTCVLDSQTKADAIIVYVYHTLLGDDGVTTVDPQEVMNWTIANSAIPIFGMLEFSIDHGALGGVVESGGEHGYEAGRMALAITRGAPVEQFPVSAAERGAILWNQPAAERWGITLPDEYADQVSIFVRIPNEQ